MRGAKGDMKMWAAGSDGRGRDSDSREAICTSPPKLKGSGSIAVVSGRELHKGSFVARL